MSSKIRKCVRSLQKNENVSELLPEYVRECMQLHGKYGKINLLLEYYLFYETVYEDEEYYLESAADTAEIFHHLLARYLNQPSQEELCNIADELLALRSKVVDKMRVLTSYVDCFSIYEYILNRVQYRFEDMEIMPADQIFAQDLMNYIFSSEDNMVIADRVRYVMEQLPMRMARSRYFEMIRDSLLLYQGSDVSAMEGFLYMFRTSAMLYQDENCKSYFTEFKKILDELSMVDYENMSEDAFHIYEEKILDSAEKLDLISDLYLQIGQAINDLYVICMTESYVDEKEAMPEEVLRDINSMFLERNFDSDKQKEEKLIQFGEKFVEVEGLQERLFESINTAGAALDGIKESYRDLIAEKGMSGDFEILDRLALLISDSTFADLNAPETEEEVTKELAEKAAAELIEECREYFKGKSRLLRRAVMANTVTKMPVFFRSAQEVADYVTSSLTGCDDEAEKYASKLLLLEYLDF